MQVKNVHLILSLVPYKVHFLMLLLYQLNQEEKSCPYYMRTGGCKFGIACKFNHPELSSAGNALPVLGTAVGGSAGFIIIPSSGLSYAGGVPSWPLINEAYSLSPLSQGLGWTTYMVSQNSSSFSSCIFLFCDLLFAHL